MQYFIRNYSWLYLSVSNEVCDWEPEQQDTRTISSLMLGRPPKVCQLNNLSISILLKEFLLIFLLPWESSLETFCVVRPLKLLRSSAFVSLSRRNFFPGNHFIHFLQFWWEPGAPVWGASLSDIKYVMSIISQMDQKQFITDCK